jgi:hypothetical protein
VDSRAGSHGAANGLGADRRISLRDDPGLGRGRLQGEVVQRDVVGNVLAIGTVEDGEYRIQFPGKATFAFRRSETEMRVAPEPSTPRDVVLELFRTAALPLMLQAHGYEAIHASAVQMPTGVAAFCGSSGAGKSTVAYGLALRGYGMWADDAVVLSISDGDREVLTPRLPHSVNLRPESRRFFGLQQDTEVAIDSAKSVQDRLAAIVVLATGSHDSREMDPLPLDTALTALLPHAYCFFAERGREQTSVTAYLDLVARVPVFHFQFPSGFAHLNRALDALEARLTQAVARA